MLFWYKNENEIGRAYCFIRKYILRKNILYKFQDDITQEVVLNLVLMTKFHGRVYFNNLSKNDVYASEYYAKIDGDKFIDIAQTDRRWKKRIEEQPSIKVSALNNRLKIDHVYPHDADIMKVSKTAVTNTNITMAKKEGHYRKAVKSDITLASDAKKEGDTIKIFYEPDYHTDNLIEGDNDELSIEDQIDGVELHIKLKTMVDERLAEIEVQDPLKSQFLSTVFWGQSDGLTYIELAESIGFYHKNIAQVVKRFTDALNKSLKEKKIELSIELTTNIVDILLGGEPNSNRQKNDQKTN